MSSLLQSCTCEGGGGRKGGGGGRGGKEGEKRAVNARGGNGIGGKG